MQTQPKLRVGCAEMRFASGSAKEQGGSLQGHRKARFRVGYTSEIRVRVGYAAVRFG